MLAGLGAPHAAIKAAMPSLPGHGPAAPCQLPAGPVWARSGERRAGRTRTQSGGRRPPALCRGLGRGGGRLSAPVPTHSAVISPPRRHHRATRRDLCRLPRGSISNAGGHAPPRHAPSPGRSPKVALARGRGSSGY